MPTDPTLWAEVPLSVGRLDVTDLTIPLRTGLRVSGRVEFDGTKEKPAGTVLTRMTIMLEPIERRGPTGPPGGQVDAGLQFKTYGVPAGKYFVHPMGPATSGWTFKAAMYQGRDVADVPLDLDSADVSGVVITFTDRPTELSGTVESSSGVRSVRDRDRLPLRQHRLDERRSRLAADAPDTRERDGLLQIHRPPRRAATTSRPYPTSLSRSGWIQNLSKPCRARRRA